MTWQNSSGRNSRNERRQHGSPLAPPWLHWSEDTTALDPSLWPVDVERGVGGVVTVSGIPVTELVRKYGTPIYVLSEKHFRKQARAYKDSFVAAFEPYGVPVEVFYAAKAFVCTEVARWVEQEGLSLDTTSGGEMLIAERAGLKGELLGLHGNNKTDAEILKALALGVSRIVVDSIDELKRIDTLVERIARTSGTAVQAPVMLRLTPGVYAHTHEFIATAHEDQKFGLSLSGDNAEGGLSPAQKAVKLALELPWIKLLGFHAHIGSQIFGADAFELAAIRLIKFMDVIKRTYQVEAAELDLGGGYGIAYTAADKPFPPAELAKAIARVVVEQTGAYGLRIPRLSIEPGRSIVGTAGFTLYTVGTIKNVTVDREGGTPSIRRYISVDGGMSDNTRPVLYNADYSATLANRISEGSPVLSRVVGKHCESGDIIVRDVYLPQDVSRGDIIAVPVTGAYCWVLANNYNYARRPAVIAVNNGASRVIIRGETDDDLLARDVSAP